MADAPSEITLNVSPDTARRLAELAVREGSSIEAVAARVLHDALTPGVIAPDPFAPGEFEARLDAIPGCYERLQESIAQGRAGKTIPLADLGK